MPIAHTDLPSTAGRAKGMNMTTAHEIGTRIGQAIARDVLADNMPREWTGLDAQDGDQLMIAGIELGTPEWEQAEQAAKAAYEAALQDAE